MQKKILWLISEYQAYFSLIEEEAKKQQVDLTLALFDNVSMSYQNNQTSVLVNGKPLESYSIVYFRNIDRKLEKHIAISAYCQTHTIVVLDKAARYQRPWIVSKNLAYLYLSHDNLPIIDTQFLSETQFEATKDTIVFPCIVKITDGAMGVGVHLCKNTSEVADLFATYQKDLIFQKFIKNEGDLRVFVLGDKVIGAMKRTTSDAKEFRNNISLGGTAAAFETTPEIEDLAIAATKSMQYTMAGVDLLFDEQIGKWVIVEINKAPQYLGIMKATGINVPALMVSYFASYSE